MHVLKTYQSNDGKISLRYIKFYLIIQNVPQLIVGQEFAGKSDVVKQVDCVHLAECLKNWDQTLFCSLLRLLTLDHNEEKEAQIGIFYLQVHFFIQKSNLLQLLPLLFQILPNLCWSTGYFSQLFEQI